MCREPASRRSESYREQTCAAPKFRTRRNSESSQAAAASPRLAGSERGLELGCRPGKISHARGTQSVSTFQVSTMNPERKGTRRSVAQSSARGICDSELGNRPGEIQASHTPHLRGCWPLLGTLRAWCGTGWMGNISGSRILTVTSLCTRITGRVAYAI